MTMPMQTLLSGHAAEIRLERADGYRFQSPESREATGIERLTHVVHVEVRSHEFYELDAGSFEHAQAILNAWMTNHKAMTAAIRSVNPDGTLSKIIGRIASSIDYEAA